MWNYCQADSFRDKEFISFKTLIYFLSFPSDRNYSQFVCWLAKQDNLAGILPSD